jgi:hypothetical protein
MYQLAWTKPAISDFQRKQRRNISDPSHNTTRWVDSCQLIILAVSHPHSAIFPYGRLTGRRPPKRACEADVYRSCRRANVGILVTVTVSSPVFPWTDANRSVSDFFLPWFLYIQIYSAQTKRKNFTLPCTFLPSRKNIQSKKINSVVLLDCFVWKSGDPPLDGYLQSAMNNPDFSFVIVSERCLFIHV